MLEVSRRYTSKGLSSRRSNTRVYYMNNGRRDVRVCKAAFLRTHAVTNGRLSRALKVYADNSGSPHPDQRGRHTPVNKTTDDDIAFVKDHIQSFPKYRSHYSRANNPIRQYLHPDLSITKMYLLYKDVCSTQGKSQVSEGIYRKVFNEQFNLSFGRYYMHAYLLAVMRFAPTLSYPSHASPTLSSLISFTLSLSRSFFFLLSLSSISHSSAPLLTHLISLSSSLTLLANLPHHLSFLSSHVSPSPSHVYTFSLKQPEI